MMLNYKIHFLYNLVQVLYQIASTMPY